MTKRVQASMTLEAALVLPLVVSVIYALMCLMSMVLVQHQMQKALADTGVILSDQAYLMEKTGLITLQADFYDQAVAREVRFESIEQAMLSHLPMDFDWDDGVHDRAGGLQFMGQMYQWLQLVTEDALLLLEGVSRSEIYAYGNSRMTAGVAKSIMTHLVDSERLEALGMVNGLKGCSFEGSTYMLDGKHVALQMTYEMALPGLLGKFGTFTMPHRVLVKGFIGNGNYRTQYTGWADAESDNSMVDVVYVTEHGQRYHPDVNCFSIHIEAKQVLYGQVGGTIHFCQTCSGSVSNLSPLTPLYKTDGDSKYHIDGQCSRITRNKQELTIHQAKAQGYTLCGHCQKRSGIYDGH